MSYSILMIIVAICLMSLLFTAICLIAFRWGVKYGIDKENAVNEPIIALPKRKPNETKEMKRFRELDKAIASYNGEE